MISVNIRGLTDKTKRCAVFDKYRKITDVLIVQETHSEKQIENIWKNEWGGQVYYAHGNSASRGVAIFIVKNAKILVKNVKTFDDGRMVMCDIEENDETITVAAIYAPNEDCPSFYQNIGKELRNKEVQKLIIGDFNLTLNVDMDRLNTYHNNNKAKEEVENLMDEFHLKDIWRIQNGNKREYSWFKKGNIQKASRIDFGLISAGLDQKVKTTTYIDSLKSDHRGLYMVIDLKLVERGRGFWKLNTKLLRNKNYIDIINAEISKTIELTQHKSGKDSWEDIKKRIKKTSIQFSKDNVSVENQVIASLSEIINDYEARLPLNCEEYELYSTTKADLEERLMDKAQGIIFRSKVKWYEEGEKNTKYFYSLEKTKYNAKTCYKVIDDNSTEYTDANKILQVQEEFYKKLYEEDKHVQFNLVNEYDIKVKDPVREIQNQQITKSDLTCAIKKMKNNRTPGKDGIPIDFYKVFWKYLEKPFLRMMQESYEEELLHTTARQGILNLIPKPKKDSRYVKNLRPITLLNTDYKIIEKAIADKMIPALEDLIHKDQRGFMKERRISVNIRKMLDIIHEAEVEDLEAIILSLDFVKCFDKCSFSILHGSLEYFDFGEIVKTWTKILYKDYSVMIQNNGHFSGQIEIKKGVHQGGCCSAIYFLVIAEILAITLRSNDDISGITIRNIRNLLNQFADDMDIFSECNELSLRQIHKELEFHY